MYNDLRKKPRKPNPAVPPNIITSDDSSVCPEHYRRLRKGCNWRKTGNTHEVCEMCLNEQSTARFVVTAHESQKHKQEV